MDLRARRYLVPFDPRRLPRVSADTLVIGSGVAALRAAVEAARHGSVLLVTKGALEECNSSLAQGGVAAAIGEGDTVEAHVQDTLRAAWGLASEALVRSTIAEGIERIRELIAWGTKFDRRGRQILLTQEGGHRIPRILHAGGDATGVELERSLIRKTRAEKAVRIQERVFVLDLLTSGGSCLGALARSEEMGLHLLSARATVLASGGCGQVYRETTNPAVATGDGMAMAWRAGAKLTDLEFVQFHPTTLYLAGASRSLISEAVRGEGGILRDREGRAFMRDLHPMADLAPRDVVSRCILHVMKKTGDTQSYLDVTHIPERTLRTRFPGVWALAKKYDLNLARRPIPVRPSAHYMIGGVRTDETGATSIRRLYAAGEVAATGFHGANRLGSNSLLECLVFGRRAGDAAGRTRGRAGTAFPRGTMHLPVPPAPDFNATDLRNALQSLMWRAAGVERTGPELSEALEQIGFWSGYVLTKNFSERSGWELQNLITVGRMIARSAYARRESRGVHYRADHPDLDDRQWRRHLVVGREAVRRPV